MRFYLGLLLLTSSVFAAEDVKLSVTITGFKPKIGSVYIALYNGEDGWLKDNGSFKNKIVPVTETELNLDFLVPRGKYAIQVFQDLNGNGKLDMRWLPPGPDEPWGVSNNRTDRLGPPRYKDAEFIVEGSNVVTINLVQK